MNSDSTSVSEVAYRRLLETLLKASDVIQGPLGARNSRERAEGYRHLLRLASVAVEMFVENGDRAHPVFTRWMEAGRKLLGDNPWTIYDVALIGPEFTYCLSGQRGETTYLGICVYGTKEDGGRCIISNIDDSDIEFAEDGSFELTLSRERPEGVVNWLQLDRETTDILVRQYFLDRSTQEKAHYEIKAQPLPPAPQALTEDELALRIDEAARWIFDIINVEVTISALAERSTPVVMRDGTDYVDAEGVNTIDYSWVAKAMPSPAITYTGNWINGLGDEEAIVITGKPPEARYWSIQFMTRWMESPDYRYHEVFFTSENTTLEADGSFRIVVAHRDPGAPNWLDTIGIESGNIAVRAVKDENEALDVHFERVTL
jgi:hypothetical protein